MKMLLVEDEPELARDILEYFSNEDYLIEKAATMEEALDRIRQFEYDCILLDIGLPDGNGLTILEKLKSLKKQDGVIIISAKDSLEDKIKGIGLGADDYLTKPFHLSELAVRIMAIIRRKKFTGQPELEIAGLKLSFEERTVFFNNLPLTLTPSEFRLLQYLMSSQNRVLSKTTLAEYLLGDQYDFVDGHQLVYTHVKNLKRKLAEAGCPDYIKTVYATGYKFTAG
jgi:DNA-binding response OmpR family regulator